MPVQLVGVGVTLPSAGVSLTPTTKQLPWSGESLLSVGQSIPGSTVPPTPPSTNFVPTYYLMYAN